MGQRWTNFYLASVLVDPALLYAGTLAVTQTRMVGLGLDTRLSQLTRHLITLIPKKKSVKIRHFLVSWKKLLDILSKILLVLMDKQEFLGQSW